MDSCVTLTISTTLVTIIFIAATDLLDQLILAATTVAAAASDFVRIAILTHHIISVRLVHLVQRAFLR